MNNNTNSYIQHLDVKACPQNDQSLNIPSRQSFEEFLLNDARVPAGHGAHGPYSFEGREALRLVVRAIDQILGSAPAEAVSHLKPKPLQLTKSGNNVSLSLGGEGRGEGARALNELSNFPVHGERSEVKGKNASPSINANSSFCTHPSCLSDSELSLAGGAQFGKTILELNLAAYLTSQRFRNFGLYLPDDDLVEGVVDSKFRPDVVDQIGWFADMVQVGKALNKSGRAVNRKGAFLVTDGKRKAVGMIRGLGKVPTTFSMDAAALDEVDDIEPKMMKFVRGRLTASDLRFILKIGTQRVHGRGMNKAWKDGSQGVFLLECPQCGRRHNPEEEFPGIVRLRVAQAFQPAGSREIPVPRSGLATGKSPEPADKNVCATPKLTWSGDFRRDGSDEIVAVHNPQNEYYLGCVSCGTELDRTQPIEEHRRPEWVRQRKWSYRISQLSIAAIDLAQIVARFQLAVADPEEMVVFRCDVLALPQSTSQALTPSILDRARSVEIFDLAPRVREGFAAYGGLDMGDRCWFFAREVLAHGHHAHGHQVLGQRVGAVHGVTNRLLAAHKFPAADVVHQAVAQFHRLGLSALFIDERPLVNEARSIALALNGLQSLAQWPRILNVNDAYVKLPGGLTWDGRKSCWYNLKCALVRFTKSRLGAGIEQTIVFFEEGGQTKFVPCIACNRFESIDRVVREFLTPAEGVVEIGADRQVRQTPGMLLPRLLPGHAPILDTLDAHLVSGSEREKEPDGAPGDYVDACENHLLLANAYSALASAVCAGAARAQNAVPIWHYKDTPQTLLVMKRLEGRVLG